MGLLALCLNVVCNSPKTKALCAEYRLRNGWSYSRISAEYGIGKLTVFKILALPSFRLTEYSELRIGFSPDVLDN